MRQAIARLGSRHPVLFGCAISCVKTGAADVVTQTQLEGRAFPEEWDRRRTAIFAGWGLAYLGGVQYWLYSFAFPRAFPGAVAFIEKPLRSKLRDSAGLLTLAKQVGFDQFVHHPWVLFPCFYLVKELVEGGSVDTGLRKWWANLRRDCAITWSVWVPAFVVNFSVCPLWLRIPFVAVVSFGFTMYFSFVRGAPQKLPDSETEKVGGAGGGGAAAAAGGGSDDGTRAAGPSDSAAGSGPVGDDGDGSRAAQRFRAAAGWVQERPNAVRGALGRDRKLRLYGLYKRVAVGPLPKEEAEEAKQGFRKPALLMAGWAALKARAKKCAWAEASDLPLAEAQREYATLVEKELGWRPPSSTS